MCVYICMCIYIYMYVCIKLNQFVIHQKLIQHCKSTILKYKKGVFLCKAVYLESNIPPY